MKHPREEWLALQATGDLPWWRAFRVRRHVAGCKGCAALVSQYGALAGELAGMPVPEPSPGMSALLLTSVPARSESLPAFPARSLAALATVFALALLVMLVRSPAPLPPAARNATATPVIPADTSATLSATSGAVVREVSGPRGRQRLAFYTTVEGRPVELSAGAGTALASHSDPRTGALLITRIGVEGLP